MLRTIDVSMGYVVQEVCDGPDPRFGQDLGAFPSQAPHFADTQARQTGQACHLVPFAGFTGLTVTLN